MKASSTFSLLTFAAIASAAQTFSLVTIRSGSDLQYAGVYSQDSKVLLGSGDSINFRLNDDGTLSDVDTGKKIAANDQKYIVQGDKKDTNFGILDEHLTYGGKEVFVACPSADNTYQLAVSGFCRNPKGVGLRVQGLKDDDSTTLVSASTVVPSTTLATSTTSSTLAESAEPTKKSTFGLVAVRSGTKFQFNTIKRVESHPHVFSVGGTEGDDLKLTLQPDTSLKDQAGRPIYVRPSGEFGDSSPWGDEPVTTGFSIENSNLVLNGKQDWMACPSGDNKFSLAINDCTGGTGIALLFAALLPAPGPRHHRTGWKHYRVRTSSDMVVHNPNNWHWVDKNCLPWTKEYFQDNVVNTSAQAGDVKLVLDNIVAITGDCDVTQRKGKVLCIYDMKLELSVTGTKPDEERFLATIVVPEFVHDQEEDEYIFEIEASEHKPEIRRLLVPELKKRLLKFQADLIRAHERDVQHATD